MNHERSQTVVSSFFSSSSNAISIGPLSFGFAYPVYASVSPPSIEFYAAAVYCGPPVYPSSSDFSFLPIA